jgi:hypothetical protein
MTNPKLRLKVVRSSDQKPVFTKSCNVQDGWNKVVIPKSNFVDNYGGLIYCNPVLWRYRKRSTC